MHVTLSKRTAASKLANPALISPLSAQISGLNPVGCTVSPASSTFENLWPYNPTNSSVIFPNPITTAPSNNGLVKVDYDINQHHHLDAFVYDIEGDDGNGRYLSTLLEH